MKANKIFMAFFVLTAIFLTSCDDDDPVAQKYTVNVTVNYPDGFSEKTAGNIDVTAENTLTGTKESVKTNASGIAVFSLLSGQYKIYALTENEEFAFNALAENVVISSDLEKTLVLNATSLQGGLLFKEIYYAGSKTADGNFYFADQFVEIYNNSDEVIYLDGIGFGVVAPTTSNTPSKWMDESGNLLPYLPLNMYSFYFPGSGKEHPLQPRSSVIVAQDGIDHQTDPVGNPMSPVNLGNADWELYVGELNGGKDADAAGVPNMSTLYGTMLTMVDALYSVMGSAYVLFKFPEGVTPQEFIANKDNLKYQPGTSSTLYPVIGKEYVIDAVEFVNADESKRNKRIPADLDAGYKAASTTYTSKSFRRKVKQIIGGKVIYKDTNNSTEDFLDESTPTPGVHPATVD